MWLPKRFPDRDEIALVLAEESRRCAPRLSSDDPTDGRLLRHRADPAAASDAYSRVVDR